MAKGKRKEIINAFKERKLSGGIYRISNKQSGQYLLGHAANLESIQNHFQFALNTGSAIHPRLKKECRELGSEAFELEILEVLEQKPEQTQAEFMDDLQTLEQLWRASLDASKEY